MPGARSSSERRVRTDSRVGALRDHRPQIRGDAPRTRLEAACVVGVQRPLEALPAHQPAVGEADAPGGEHAGERMDQDLRECRARRRRGRRAAAPRRRNRERELRPGRVPRGPTRAGSRAPSTRPRRRGSRRRAARRRARRGAAPSAASASKRSCATMPRPAAGRRARRTSPGKLPGGCGRAAPGCP